MVEVTPDRFRFYRKAMQMTQVELAEHMGTTRTTISRWESGRAKINQGWAKNAFYPVDTLLQQESLAREREPVPCHRSMVTTLLELHVTRVREIEETYSTSRNLCMFMEA